MLYRYSDDRLALDAVATSSSTIGVGLDNNAALQAAAAAGLGSQAQVAADPLQQLWFQVCAGFMGVYLSSPVIQAFAA